MEIILISELNELEQFREEWSQLLEENQNTNPFIEFNWIYLWWKHLGENINVEVSVVKKEGQIIAFFPFVYWKKLFVYKYCFMAQGKANYMDFVAKQDLLDEAIEFALNEIMNRNKNVVFYLHGLLESKKTPKSLETYLNKRKSRFSVHRVITPYIDLEKIKLKEYMDKRNKLHRLDRREKRLRENGKIIFSKSGTDEMEYIFKLHDDRWKKKRDTSGFTNRKEKEFFRSLASLNEGPMQTEIDSLYINDSMIAFHYGFSCRGRLLGYVLGYDEDFETFSPGRILEKEKIFQCKQEDIKNFDLSIGYEPYKFEWNTDVDYTRKMIFSSDTVFAKVSRNILTKQEVLIDRMKQNYSFVLFIRNTVGYIQYIFKNLIDKSESKIVRGEIKDFITRIKKYCFERERYVVYKMEKKDVLDVPISKEFIELTINDAMKCNKIASKHMKEICRKMYGGYKGYYPKDNLTFDNILWTNEKVLRIDRISYIEQFRKSSVYLKNWNPGNLSEICSLIKRNSKARTVYVTVENHAKKEKKELEKIGFSVSKHILKRTFFGFGKYHITN